MRKLHDINIWINRTVIQGGSVELETLKDDSPSDSPVDIHNGWASVK